MNRSGQPAGLLLPEGKGGLAATDICLVKLRLNVGLPKIFHVTRLCFDQGLRWFRKSKSRLKRLKI